MSVKVTLKQPGGSPPSGPTDSEAAEVTDSLGRKLTIKEPDILQEARLSRVVGADASTNIGYMLGYVMPAAMVTAIDGDDLIFPMTEREIDAAIKRLGRPGIGAVMAHLTSKGKNTEAENAEIKK